MLTITDPGHKLNAGDVVSLSNLNSDPNDIWDAGTPGGTNYDIATIVDANNYTVTVPNAGSVGPAGGFVRSFRLMLHPTLKAIAGAPPMRVDGYLGYPVGAIRLNVTNYVAGKAELVVNQGKGN